MASHCATCPSCGAAVGEPFYEIPAVPTNSCLLVADRNEALSFPVAPLRLSFCTSCGFIFNAAWEPARTNYSAEYEETQGFSPTFDAFQKRLVRDLVTRHNLYGKRIVEIGCGKGEFLCLLSRLGNNTGLGYDPSFVPARATPDLPDVRIVRRFFDANTEPFSCDFLCCKMTFEHIFNVHGFLAAIRRYLDQSSEAEVFFQVPEAGRIFRNVAFWDIYYEHCSYFTTANLINLFERSGFAVQRVWTDYDGQYLMIESRPADQLETDRASAAVVAQAAAEIERFRTEVAKAIMGWRERLVTNFNAGKRILVWGSGSKAVAFLTSVGGGPEVLAVVDINPFRQGYFMPTTGQPIISPEQAAAMRPDMVIVMNPVYRDEICGALRERGCQADILTV